MPAFHRPQPIEGRPHARTAKSHGIMISLFLVSAVVLGGASAPSSLGAAILRILSAAVLAILIWRMRQKGAFPVALVWGVCSVLALAAFQLIPMPMAMWDALPGRTLIDEGLEPGAMPQAWFPMSLNPMSTARAVLAGLPLLTMLALMATTLTDEVERVSWVVLPVVLLSWALGVLQMVGGPESALYLHAITNRGLAVGFFANANHLATLLVIGTPIAAMLIEKTLKGRNLATGYAFIALAAYIGLAALGITLTGSVAGILLLPVAALPSLFLLPGEKPRTRAFGGLSSIAVAAAAIFFSIGVLGTSLDEGALSRPGIWRTTWEGIETFWPLGSGLGTFPTVYPVFENPNELTSRFVNHAHNDYLELLFEAGIAGAILMLAALASWVFATVAVWRHGDSVTAWARAASIVLGILLVHSVFDYPLRTPALMVVAGFYGFVLARGVRAARATQGETLTQYQDGRAGVRR